MSTFYSCSPKKLRAKRIFFSISLNSKIMKKRTAKAIAVHKANAIKRNAAETCAPIPPPIKVPAEDMVAAALYTGTTFQQQHDSLLMMGLIPESRSSFYRKQKVSVENIKQATEASMKSARERFSGNAAIDGRWAHRVRSPQGTVIMADTSSEDRAVLWRENLICEGGGRKNPNYTGSPGNMETEGTRRMFTKLYNEGFLEKIDTITRDRDNKSGKIMNQFDIRERELHDPGHVKKSFSKKLSAFINSYRNYEYTTQEGTDVCIRSPFQGLKGPLENYFSYVIKEEDRDIREYKWLNAVDHFTGNHENCEHKDDLSCYFWRTGYEHPPLQKILYNFLNDFSPIIRKLCSSHSSQIVESINSSIAASAPKNISWKEYEARVDVAILKHNEPFEAPRIIRECCGVREPSTMVQNEWEKTTSSIKSRREESHSPQQIRKKNARRYREKNKYKITDSCDYKNSKIEDE